MENDSEKTKRGRPAVLSVEFEQGLRSLFPENTTTRSLRDVYYRVRAQGLILKARKAGASWSKWLIDEERADAGERGGYKGTILTALGYIADDDDLLATAKFICEIQPTARRAVQILRRARMSKVKVASVVDLTNRFIATLNEYINAHPDCTRQMMFDALMNVGDAVEQRVNSGDGEIE
ncbi:MAG TPA: hypothetical protein VM223_11460 [Planctomycetota bacterium]|nr:hypothetical protein [Planctomycetota bacterium]